MPVSKHDPYTARELAQILAIGVRVARRQQRGKPVKALGNRADRIREKAQAREDAKANARK